LTDIGNSPNIRLVTATRRNGKQLAAIETLKIGISISIAKRDANSSLG